MTLTDRDTDVVSRLVFDVRIFEEMQVLNAWWPHTSSGRKNGQRRLRTYCRDQLWERYKVHARAVRNVVLLAAGGPGDPDPDCHQLSRESRRLWSRIPVRPVTVYVATVRARNIFGGLRWHRVHALSQISHDLGCSALLSHLIQFQPQLAAAWRSEDEQLLPAGFGDAQPDALLVDEQGRPSVAMEFAADYAADRFRRLFRTFSEQGLSYQIYGALP